MLSDSARGSVRESKLWEEFSMEPSSRTPEGEPNRCPVCGKTVRIDPSRPQGDAPCPHCGHLLWFGPPQQRSDKEELANQASRLRQGEITLGDFKRQIVQMKRLGWIMSILPGKSSILDTLAELDTDRDMRRSSGIIDAMTPEERRNPKDILDASRRCRVAKGAGVMPSDVSSLVEQFVSIANMVKKMSSKSVSD
jgi:hypothetical protein